jgi:hypothetical protein
MSVFEQFRPFVGLCQACGMIPYTIENKLITNKFSRFTFSLKHRTTFHGHGSRYMHFSFSIRKFVPRGLLLKKKTGQYIHRSKSTHNRQCFVCGKLIWNIYLIIIVTLDRDALPPAASCCRSRAKSREAFRI